MYSIMWKPKYFHTMTISTAENAQFLSASKPAAGYLPDSHKFTLSLARAPRGLRVSAFSGPDAKRDGEASAGQMCGRAKLEARRAHFVFIIRALPATGAPSHAIFVSDFQDLCYRCSWFPKRPRARPEARRAWIAGRLLRSRRGSILVARRCGGASSRFTRAGAGAEGRVGEKSGSQALEKTRFAEERNLDF